MSQTMQEHESRRALYRVVYPLIERPKFAVGEVAHEVIDCSERGLRYEAKDFRMPALDDHVEGVVHFRRGGQVAVEGTVIRARAGMVVIALNPPLPFAEIMAEQRYLRSKGYLLREANTFLR